MLPRSCLLCSEVLSLERVPGGICGGCHSRLDLFSREEVLDQDDGRDTLYLGFYTGDLAKLLIDYKKGRRPGHHRVIAAIMAPGVITLCRAIKERRHIRTVCLCWPPGSRSGVALRGYDHMKLICRSISKILGRELPELGFTIKDLFRRRSQLQQKSLNREERIAHAPNAFALRHRQLCTIPQDCYFLLLDDVMTTGSSLKACLGLLRDSGRKKVSAAAFLSD